MELSNKAETSFVIKYDCFLILYTPFFYLFISII
jgi:hypothetical protein